MRLTDDINHQQTNHLKWLKWINLLDQSDSDSSLYFLCDSPASCQFTSDWRRRWVPPAGHSPDRTLHPGANTTANNMTHRNDNVLQYTEWMYCSQTVEGLWTRIRFHLCLASGFQVYPDLLDLELTHLLVNLLSLSFSSWKINSSRSYHLKLIHITSISRLITWLYPCWL